MGQPPAGGDAGDVGDPAAGADRDDDPLSWKVNSSSGLPLSSASRLRATVSPSSSAT
jgi:hypothetical protein